MTDPNFGKCETMDPPQAHHQQRQGFFFSLLDDSFLFLLNLKVTLCKAKDLCNICSSAHEGTRIALYKHYTLYILQWSRFLSACSQPCLWNIRHLECASITTPRATWYMFSRWKILTVYRESPGDISELSCNLLILLEYYRQLWWFSFIWNSSSITINIPYSGCHSALSRYAPSA